MQGEAAGLGIGILGEMGGDADSPVLVRILGNTTALTPMLPLLPPEPEDLFDCPAPPPLVLLPNAPRLLPARHDIISRD